MFPRKATDWMPRKPPEALEDLPTEQREVIVARLWGGLSFDEIAEINGTAASTAHRRYQQGIAALREKLEGICPHKRKN